MVIFHIYQIYSQFIKQSMLNNAKKQKQFGSTYDLHSSWMDLLWGPGINLFIIIVLYSYRKYYVYAHSIFGLFITIFTIYTSLPILLQTGIITTADNGDYVYAHYIVGIASMSAVLLLALFGIATKVMNILQFSSMTIIILKNTHRVLGYLISILVKSNIYIIYGPSSDKFWMYFAQDLLCLIIIIVRKLKFPKMEHIVSTKKKMKIPFFKPTHGINIAQQYCTFENYIYSLLPLKINHPAGFQIIQSVKNRDIDRFIYGMYGAQAHPEVWSHSHSFRSLQLLGDPIGKLSIQSNYYGFDENSTSKINVQQISEVSKNGLIFEVKLQKQSNRIVFRAYENIAQLGRFHSLTVNKTTRLYTSVNFLTSKNKRFMQSLFEGKLPKEESVYERQGYLPPKQERSNQVNDEYIPLLIKRYPDGKLTEYLIQNPSEEMVMSSQKGEGLQLDSLPSHKIAIVAGGTGLFPFYDLLDLFFKSELVKSNESYREKVVKVSPIIERYAFSSFSFDLYVAVNSIEDIHPIILQQFLFLLKASNSFTLTLRTKDSNEVIANLQSYKNCVITSSKFEEILDESLKIDELSKIYICGPPRMNEGLSKYFREKPIDQKLYQFM